MRASKGSVRLGLPTMLAAIIALAQLLACSTEQLYRTVQAVRRTECGTIYDARERKKCVESSSLTHEEYLQQRRNAKGKQ